MQYFTIPAEMYVYNLYLGNIQLMFVHRYIEYYYLCMKYINTHTHFIFICMCIFANISLDGIYRCMVFRWSCNYSTREYGTGTWNSKEKWKDWEAVSDSSVQFIKFVVKELSCSSGFDAIYYTSLCSEFRKPQAYSLRQW